MENIIAGKRRGIEGVEGLQRLVEPPLRTNLVIDAIRNAILDGLFPPGQQLVERVLAGQLGVSKTPIREALRSLENSGLLESNPAGGVVVRRVNTKLVEDLYEFRLLVEPAAVRLSVPHLSDAALKKARRLLDKGRELGLKDDFAELSRTNRRFHEVLYEACPNQLLKTGLNGLRDQLRFVVASGWRTHRSWETEAKEHLAILEAVCRRDADAAELLTHAHVKSAWSRLVAGIS